MLDRPAQPGLQAQGLRCPPGRAEPQQEPELAKEPTCTSRQTSTQAISTPTATSTSCWQSSLCLPTGPTLLSRSCPTLTHSVRLQVSDQGLPVQVGQPVLALYQRQQPQVRLASGQVCVFRRPNTVVKILSNTDSFRSAPDQRQQPQVRLAGGQVRVFRRSDTVVKILSNANSSCSAHDT